MKDRELEFKVGLLIVGALVILGTFFFVLGNFSVGSGYHVYVDYNFTGNIQPGASVKVSGIKVGKVEDIQFLGGQLDTKTGRRVQVRLKVWVEDRVKETLRENAEFFVNTAGVLGEQYLEIVPGSYDRPALPAGSTVVGVDPPRTDLIVARLYEFLESVTSLLHDQKDAIRELLTNGAAAIREVNVLLAENRQEIGKLIVTADKLASEGALVLADVRKGLGDPTIIARTIQDADLLLAGGHRAVSELVPRATKLLDEGVRITGIITEDRVDKAIDAADSLVVVLNKSGTLVDHVVAVIQDLRAGKGTAGKLLAREELYADLKEMVVDLKRNPWKLIWKE